MDLIQRFSMGSMPDSNTKLMNESWINTMIELTDSLILWEFEYHCHSVINMLSKDSWDFH